MAKKTSKKEVNSGSVNVPSNGTVLANKISPKLFQKMEFGEQGKIGGVVISSESVSTTYGESTKFKGDFAAKLPDGTVVRSSQCYLPRTAEGIISAALASKMNEENFKGVEFAFGISKIENEASKVGYEWQVKTLVDTAPAEDKVLLLLGN